MLQNNDEQEKSKYEQISIIPKRKVDQKLFRPCVSPSQAIDLFIQRKLHAVEPTIYYESSQIIEALLRCNSGQVMDKTVLRITSSDQPSKY
ncbi:unnamed protein product [Adineta steineri]|uniref:Uncharacterized protein n=2 Tax=Adineta steineri TaxID=433720 RepID=A0A815R375_9BILA|nr:unnamed protein product [Adineta steineri]CAF1635603.1 unnamed protein product [Adineta steineri]